MVLTRTQQEDTCKHIFENVLNQPTDSAIHKVFGKSLDPAFVSTVADADIDLLSYKDDSDAIQHLDVYQKSLLKAFRNFVAHHQDTVGPIVDTDWTSFSREAFDAFRISAHNRVPISARMPVSLRSSGTPGTSSAPTRDPVHEFRRGIKRDPASFTQLKDEKQWDTWRRHTVAVARAQDIADVLDPNYSPSTPTDVSLFAEKQKYVYSVLETNLLTDKGKALVRQHETTGDAQALYRALVTHAQASTQASLESSELLSYVTSTRIGDGTWKGSTQSFVLHWQDQVRIYESLVKSSDHFSDGQKRTMLENAVHPLKDLRAVRDQAQQHKTQTGSDLTYAQYSDLLLSAAQAYDKQFAATPSARASRRSIYSHDLISADLAPDPHPDIQFDIDSPVDVLQAHAAGTFRPRSRLTGDQWHRLSPQAQSIWDQLDESSKQIVLEPRRSRPPGPSRPAPRPSPARTPRSANLHDLAFDVIAPDAQMGSDSDGLNDPDTDMDPHCATEQPLLAHMTNRKKFPPTDLRRILSQPSKSDPSSNTDKSIDKTTKPSTDAHNHEISLNGRTYRSVNQHAIVYRASKHRTTRCGSLVDRGANGGIAGADVRVIVKSPHRIVDVQGIDNHQIADIPIVTAGGVIKTQRGEVIAILHQYAHIGTGKTIHSSGQLEWHKNDVNDRSVKVQGGLQRIVTLDGYTIPINIHSGLPYVPIRPYTDEEWETLPHVVLTSDADWDPSVLDHRLDDDEEWFDAVSDLQDDPTTNLFDEFGNCRKRHIVNEALFYDCGLEDHLLATETLLHEVHEREIRPQEPDYKSYIPMFGWQPLDTIKRTFAATTQHARMPMGTHLKSHFKSPFPALNVPRRDEPVATDTVYSDTPAVDDGATSAQFFCGTKSLVCDVQGMKTDKQFINTLEDNIRRRGAPTKLISDRAQVEISNKTKDILRNMCIDDWQSEPHKQFQNPSERRYQTCKNMANRVMDRTGAPAGTWLLALSYVCFVLNYTACAALNWCVPMSVLLGTTVDISPILRFRFWQPVYFKREDTGFPSDSPEILGNFVGFSETVGHRMAIKVLTTDTQKVLIRSEVRPADNQDAPNLRLDPLDGEKVPSIIKSRHDNDTGESKRIEMPVFDPSEIIGRTFLTTPEEDGQRSRVRIIRAIEDHENDLKEDPERMKFLCSIGDDQREEIFAYGDIMNHIEKDAEDTVLWKFRRIVAHEGPLTPDHRNYKGSSHNVMMEWETGEVTSEPLSIIGKDDPVTCAIYARENNLLDTPGWKRFKSIARRQKKLFRMANQAKLRSFRTAPRYKYGFEIPRDHKHAMELDKRNGNTRWSDATLLEIQLLGEYRVFIDHGHKDDASAPEGFKKIRVHIVYDVKHDGRHRARCVADGHLTDIPVDSVYSGVVSLRGIRILMFLAEHNDLEAWGADISSAYLCAETKEKLYIIAGPEFGSLEGHILVIFKSLYGLRSSGVRWHEKLADCLRTLGFFPCKAEPDIWMRANGNVYEYVATYVDDLAMTLKDPQAFIDEFNEKFGFEFKGVGPISFHLGCDFFRDEHGVMCLSPMKFIGRMLDGYKQMFGTGPPKNMSSPLEKGDHPEMDTSSFLEPDGVQKYQSLIGSLQWAVSLCRFDIATAVMTLSSFRAAPRKGHLDRAKRVCGYVAKMKHAAIRIRTNEPDYSDIPDPTYDWSHSVYGNPEEIIPEDAPTPLGKRVVLSHWVDANLYHCWLTGRAVTGTLHLINQFPFDWSTRKQATVETATHGAEFLAARTCVEQIIDIRVTLRYLGVRVHGKSHMFGDNRSVVDGSMLPHAKLHKRHTALSFHRVREAISSKMLSFFHVPSEQNPADLLSKHWGYSQVWHHLQPLLFWHGDTIDIPDVRSSFKPNGEY